MLFTSRTVRVFVPAVVMCVTVISLFGPIRHARADSMCTSYVTVAPTTVGPNGTVQGGIYVPATWSSRETSYNQNGSLSPSFVDVSRYSVSSGIIYPAGRYDVSASITTAGWLTFVARC